MTPEDQILAVTYYSPFGLSWARVRDVMPDLSRATSRDEAVAVMAEHLYFLASNMTYFKAKAIRLEAENKALRGETEPDPTRAYYPKPVLHADRRGPWHRDDLGAGVKA